MQKRIALRKGTVLQSRYRVLRRLGSGGMGAVYEAEDVRLKNRLVALKETFADDAETRQAFEREAELLANTEHDAFPCVIDYFTEADGCFLVMELIRGEDLQEILKRRDTAFDEDRVLEWADQILDALEDLHRQKIVHRDIKPANLKLTPRGRIKLLDFGIAKGNAGEAPAATTIGGFAATLQYAPLEQVLRADSYYHQILSDNFAEKVETILRGGTDVRSDLYALGATIYQLVTKRLPKNAPTRATAVWSGQKDKLVPADKANPRVSPQVAALLQKLLELEPENRPASAADARRLIRKARAAKFKADELLNEISSIESPEADTFAAESFPPERDNGILNIRVEKRTFVANAPKFESISGSKRLSFVVAAVVLIAVLGTAFALSSKQKAVEQSEMPPEVVETKQQNFKTNAERENKLKSSSQPQPKTTIENHKPRSLPIAAKSEAKLIQPPDTVSPPSASRQRIIVDKSKTEKTAEDFKNGAN